jgi:antitoxin ParD1/3/4
MTTKIAISLPDAQVQALRRSVETGEAASVSGRISQAISRMEREDSLAALLDDLDRELGCPSAATFAWADKALGLA